MLPAKTNEDRTTSRKALCCVNVVRLSSEGRKCAKTNCIDFSQKGFCNSENDDDDVTILASLRKGVARKPGNKITDSNQHTFGLGKEILRKRKYHLLLDHE